jgi:dolichol-phosphate mannosyltransferase
MREMGSRYLFIVLYLFLEKYLARGDYQRVSVADDDEVLAFRSEK